MLLEKKKEGGKKPTLFVVMTNRDKCSSGTLFLSLPPASTLLSVGPYCFQDTFKFDSLLHNWVSLTLTEVAWQHDLEGAHQHV